MDDRYSVSSEEVLDFNFWPSFSDLMLSLVLILILVMFLFLNVITVGTVDLRDVEENQQGMVKEIADAFNAEGKEIKPNCYEIQNAGIMIQNEPTLQRITFSDRILFPKDRYKLSEKGKQTLRIVGEKIKRKLAIVREMQIQGHADTDKSKDPPSNLELAALRAIEVFEYFQNEVGIDACKHLMSATSFGEFKPMQRSDEDRSYDRERLDRDNSSPSLKDGNRRIELLLFYSPQRRGDVKYPGTPASMVETPQGLPRVPGASPKTAESPSIPQGIEPSTAKASLRRPEMEKMPSQEPVPDSKK